MLDFLKSKDDTFALISQEDVSTDAVSKDEKVRIYTELNAIEGLVEMLRAMAQNDLITYVNAPADQKEMVKGALLRTKYLINMIKRRGEIKP